jgi:hypothetical protein
MNFATMSHLVFYRHSPALLYLYLWLCVKNGQAVLKIFLMHLKIYMICLIMCALNGNEMYSSYCQEYSYFFRKKYL